MMKTNYLTVMALSLLASLSGCQAEGDEQDKPQGTIPVGFSGDVSQTRAGTEYASAADLTAIGVFAYFTNGAFSEGSATPNFMYNQKVERQSNGSWTYSPVKYWPNNAKDKLSFFAYAPYMDEKATGGTNPTISGNTATGFPKLTYTVPAAAANQTDLLASVPLMNRTYTNDGKVAFTMNHALTKAAVCIKSKDKESNKKLTAFTITSATSGTLTFRAPANDADKGFAWSGITGIRTYTPASQKVDIPANTTDEISLATFYLLPQGTGSKFDISYTYSATVSNGSVAAPTHTVTLTGQPLPSLDKWEAGAFVNYRFAIGKTEITVTATQYPTWTNAGSGTVTGSYTITYATSPTNPGWSNGGTGTVNGQPVTTHTASRWGGNAEWEEGTDESIEGFN